jgi:hypothetical protein
MDQRTHQRSTESRCSFVIRRQNWTKIDLLSFDWIRIIALTIVSLSLFFPFECICSYLAQISITLNPPFAFVTSSYRRLLSSALPLQLCSFVSPDLLLSLNSLLQSYAYFVRLFVFRYHSQTSVIFHTFILLTRASSKRPLSSQSLSCIRLLYIKHILSLSLSSVVRHIAHPPH